VSGLRFDGVERIIPESPERLRDCLIALAQAVGADVHRCEVTESEGGGIRVIVTSSRAESEIEIAGRIGKALEALFAAPSEEKR
jgi:hypothetical protein